LTWIGSPWVAYIYQMVEIKVERGRILEKNQMIQYIQTIVTQLRRYDGGPHINTDV